MDVLSKEQRRKNMQAIRCKDTKDEVLLAKSLWNRGHRYRKNDKTVFGKPDLTFKKCRLAIFVDSEFFHGKDWDTQKHRIKSNQEFWWKKIERNITRDQQVNEHLINTGWNIIRFWSKDIRNNLANCIFLIEQNIAGGKDNIQSD